MASNVRKYILIPEWAPLYAMRECYGPTHGPLKEPTPTPVDIIGKLLLQSGKEALTIHEVIKEGKGFSKPVRLTKENYRLPYEEIAGVVKPDSNEGDHTPMTTPVNPVYVDDDTTPENGADTTVNSEDTDPHYDTVLPEVETPAVEEIEEKIGETPAEDPIVDEVPVETAEETESTVPAENIDPYAGMSKSQRKKARREEAARKALEEVMNTTVSDNTPSEDSEDESSNTEE